MIWVSGATGFVGQHMIAKLLALQLPCRALVRLGQGSQVPGAWHALELDHANPQALAQAAQDGDVLLHLLGKINGPPEELIQVNVEYTRKLLQALHNLRLARLVFLSSAAAQTLKGPYGQAKARAEELIRASGLPAVILRSTLIYGPGDNKNIAQMVKWVKHWPVLPILGSGEFRFQPIAVEDVVEVLLQSLTRPVIGRTYVLAQPETLSLLELLRLIEQSTGQHPWHIHVPLNFLKPLVRAYARIFSNTTLPIKQILEIDQHEQFSVADLLRDFKINPIPPEIGISRYLAGMGRAA